jgi:hypothetical protein
VLIFWKKRRASARLSGNHPPQQAKALLLQFLLKPI